MRPDTMTKLFAGVEIEGETPRINTIETLTDSTDAAAVGADSYAAPSTVNDDLPEESDMTKFYMAGTFSRRPEVLSLANRIADMTGWSCTSRWLTLNVQDNDPADNADMDFADIDEASLLVLLGTRPSMGKFIEMGYAIGNHKPVVVLTELNDPVTSIFLSHGTVVLAPMYDDIAMLTGLYQAESLATREEEPIHIRPLEWYLRESYRMAKAHGFWSDPEGRNKGETIALIHSELSEMLEAVREPSTSPHTGLSMEAEEAADVFIRLADYCQGYGINLTDAVCRKMEYNSTRGPLHGKRF